MKKVEKIKNRNLEPTTISISRKSKELLKSKMMKGEAIHNVFDRIIAAYYENDQNDWYYLYQDALNTIKDLRKKLNEKQTVIQ